MNILSKIALVLVPVIVLGCGDDPGGTSGTGGAGGTGSTSSASTGSGSGSICEKLCQDLATCEVDITPEQCLANCAEADEAYLTCVAGCNQEVCSLEWMTCSTVCHDSGGPGGDPYGSDITSCGDGFSVGVNCPPEVVICMVTQLGDEKESVCVPYCSADKTCPVPATGNAVPTCGTEDQPPTCTLDCSGGKTCPDGMICSLANDRCMWAVP
ncbi:hypothetical protein [Polyangium sp. 6x1]|uniref:hypothetical protein n=1 Tax=Polyangium sp. 6x1 TaxID=3042689 RepID=UPI002482BCDC|nr:hypothetical protein [Polyangium sp. 6x1]MDI1446415.1 hypothetical protein [Polyangium sp. 6x1]